MAWFKSTALAPSSVPARTKTLAEIMREEEDAKLAAKFAVPVVEDEDEQLRLVLELSRITEEEDRKRRQLEEDEALARVIAQELNKTDNHEDPILSGDQGTAGFPPDSNTDGDISATDEDLASFLESDSYDEDAMLAKFLQMEERRQAGSYQYLSMYKELTPIEQKLYNAKFDSEESDDDDLDDDEDDANDTHNTRSYPQEAEEDEAESSEYNYDDPSILRQSDLNPEEARAQLKRLFDRAQRREDQELAYITRRDKGKRVNATFVALHHQNFESRNVGKRQAEILKPYDGSQKGKRARREGKVRRQHLLGLPYSNPDFYAFGLVEFVMGGSHFIVYCYQDGAYYRGRVTKLLKRSNVWIEKGDVIVIKIRGKIMADILMKLSEEEYFLLPRLGCMKEHDPVKLLPREILAMIFKELPWSDCENCLLVNDQWKEVITLIRASLTEPLLQASAVSETIL